MKNKFTFIVQATRKMPDNSLICLNPVYFENCEDAIEYFDIYLEAIKENEAIHSVWIASEHSVTTDMPYIESWTRKMEGEK